MIKVFLFVLIVMFRLCASKSPSLDLATFGFIVCGCTDSAEESLRNAPNDSGPNRFICVHTFLQSQVSSTFCISKLMFYSVIGLVVAVNIAIVVIGWPYAYGEFQAYPSLRYRSYGRYSYG